jgi:uncharacterized membrane protein
MTAQTTSPPPALPVVPAFRRALQSPSTREIVFAWFSYAMTGFGLFLLWPALAGVFTSLVRRGDTRGTVLESHHQWLIRTFWIAALGYIACIVLVFLGAWDLIVAAVRAAPTAELSLNWGEILTGASTAAIGGLGMTCLWFWTLARVVRGMLRLYDGRAVP